MPGNDLLDQALAIGVVPALTGCAMANEDITDSEDRDLLARLVFILAMGPEDAPALLAWADIDEGEGVAIILVQGTADGEPAQRGSGPVSDEVSPRRNAWRDLVSPRTVKS